VSSPVTTYNYSAPEGVPLPLDLRVYRVLAWITGVLLVILVFVGLPLKYFADVPAVDAIVGVAHGVFFFPAYVVATLVVGYRRAWSIIKILVVAACGVIPFGSFVAEHRIVREEALRGAPLDVQP
jgi:integral membrane protein